MKKSLQLTASMTLVTLLVSSSAFAETRHLGETDSYRNGSRSVSVEGRIRDIGRDRNGFVIRLDRGSYELFVSPQLGRSVRNLDRGDVIRAYGRIDSRGTMLVDDLTLMRNADRNDRNDHSVRGVVQSVDISRRVVSVRDDRSGRIILVDLRNAERNDRRWDNDQRDDRRDTRQDRWNDLTRIRRGDRLSARGEYRGNGRFEAERYNLGENGSW
jgi:hypothetical protein